MLLLHFFPLFGLKDTSHCSKDIQKNCNMSEKVTPAVRFVSTPQKCNLQHVSWSQILIVFWTSSSTEGRDAVSIETFKLLHCFLINKNRINMHQTDAAALSVTVLLDKTWRVLYSVQENIWVVSDFLCFYSTLNLKPHNKTTLIYY